MHFIDFTHTHIYGKFLFFIFELHVPQGKLVRSDLRVATDSVTDSPGQTGELSVSWNTNVNNNIVRYLTVVLLQSVSACESL